MTELSFLIDLLLNHTLEKKTKDAIASRIIEVEKDLVARTTQSQYSMPVQRLPNPLPPASIQSQAPSTLALMQKHGDVAGNISLPDSAVTEAPPVAIVAHTPATAAAMAARAEMINSAIAGKGPQKNRRF